MRMETYMSFIMRNLIILMAALVFTGCATVQNAVETAAIPDGKVGLSEFANLDSTSVQSVDHSAFDQFLSKYLVTSQAANPVTQGANLVRYGDVTEADKLALIAYINRLQATSVSSLNRNEQLAFWINLYNAETLRVIVENYPVDSIRDIKDGTFDVKGPWNDVRLTVEGTELTLEDIENKIVRPNFQDARIHYGLNCAAIGCPNLRGEAYKASNLDAALETQTRAFINNARGVKVVDGKLTVSRIFLWYADDWGSKDDILTHIRQYASPELKQDLDGIMSISKYEYDWSLNDAARVSPP